MKRIPAAILAITMLLSLCACGNDEGGRLADNIGKAEIPSAAPSPAPATETPPTAPSEPKPELSPDPSAEATGPELIRLWRCSDSMQEWGDYEMKLSIEWDKIMLFGEDAEKYPRLAASLDRMRMEDDDERLAEREGLLLSYDEMVKTGYPNPLAYTSSVSVRRADSCAVSLMEDNYYYSGGAHPSYGVTGINLDPESGREILIGDVIPEWESLASLLGAMLTEKYGDIGYEDFSTQLESYGETDYNWTIDYQGVSFYFNPYNLGPYAIGMLELRLWFDEYPDLFNGKYLDTPSEGWAMSLSSGYPLEFDMYPGDGRRDTVGVFLSYGEEDYDIGDITVNLNGRECSDGYSYFTDSYLLHDGEDGWYLYTIGTAENDYRTLYVYDLKSGEPKYIGELPSTGMHGVWFDDMGIYGEYYRAVITDPDDFVLSTRMNLLGTYSAVRNYSLGREDGMPVSAGDYYDIPADTASIVSKIPLSVIILPDMKREELPSGTAFSFLRTDGESWVEMRLDDGRECRIELELSDWYCTINGVGEWECFEQLYYAG